MTQRGDKAARIVAAAILAVVPAALAQNNNASRLGPADAAFAQKAAAAGVAEVRMGTLAQERAADPDVKAYGKRMVEDHTHIDQELGTIASRSGIALPAIPGATAEQEYNRLSRLSGPAFDRAYIRDMMADHRADAAEFRREANDGFNPEMKAFAIRNLPTVEEHLKLAETAERAVRAEK